MKVKLFFTFSISLIIYFIFANNYLFAANTIPPCSSNHWCTTTSVDNVPAGWWKNLWNKIIYTPKSSQRTRQENYQENECYWDWWEYSQYICNTVTKTRTVWYTEHLYCPDWQSLIDDDANKPALTNWSLPRDWTLSCMVRDNQAPEVAVKLIWTDATSVINNTTNNKIEKFYNTDWTNSDVKLEIIVKDTWLWLKKSRYKVNDDSVKNTNIQNNTSTYSIELSEEWSYKVVIWAEDNSTHIWKTWESSNIWNLIEVTYTINIDKSKPVLNIIPSTNYDWTNQKHILSFNVKDTYKWENIEIKTFNCSWLPENAVWTEPTWKDWNITWTCDPSNKDCSNNNNFSPNINNCSWKCNSWFTEWSDWKCYANETYLQCNSESLPKWEYMYDTWKKIEKIWENTVSIWSLPTWISSDWKFLATFSKSSSSYFPSTNNCWFECWSWYHNEWWKCVNDVRIYCCWERPPLTWAVWTEVDCTVNPESKPQCVQSPLCWWEKEVLWQWSKPEKKWIFATSTDWIWNLDYLCSFETFPNSDSYTCNPWYYLTYFEDWELKWQPKWCVEVPIWEWSWQENEKRACTNKPANSIYTSNWTNNDCEWKCNSDFIKSYKSCMRESRTSSCSWLPQNAIWNSVSSITQQKNNWIRWPTTIWEYNTETSTSECRYKCKSNYSWDEWRSKCIADSRETSCWSLPANAEWNTDSNYSQTWDWDSWAPIKTPNYNQNASQNDCRYQCKDGYHWNSESKSCLSNTKETSCWILPTNTTWNTSNNYIQTWNWYSWTPIKTPNYDENPSENDCRYKCVIWKDWDEWSSKCK